MFGKLVPAVCIKKNEEMYKNWSIGKKTDSKLEGDLVKINNMSSWNAAFARPSNIKICYDNEQIVGL